MATNTDQASSRGSALSPRALRAQRDARRPVRTPGPTDRSIDTYRTAHLLRDGPFPQFQGLLEDDVVVALDDPRTITGMLESGDSGELVEVPVLTPVDLVSWYSPEYREHRFRTELAAGATAWHLSTFPSTPDADFARLLTTAVDRLDATYPGPVLLFADHAERSDDPSERRLDDLLRQHFARIQRSVTEHPAAREHYLAGVFEAAEDHDPLRAALDTIDLRTSVSTTSPGEHFVDELWAIYERPFKQIAVSTPLRPYFTRSELADVLEKAGSIQVAHRQHDHLVAWTMMTTRFDSFPWMDPDSFYAVDPTVPRDRVHVFPGLVTDENHRGQHCADRLFAGIALALLQQGNRHLIVFETVDENIGFLPQLIEAAATGNGYGTIQFDPVGVQRLRAWDIA